MADKLPLFSLKPSPEFIENVVDEYLDDNPVSAGLNHTQVVPISSWTIPHGFNRIPAVSVYVNDVLVIADVTVTNEIVIVNFPAPTIGVAVLT